MVPWGVQRNKWEILAQTYKKREAENEKWLTGNFLSNSRKICHHFAFVVHRKTVLNVTFEGVYIST